MVTGDLNTLTSHESIGLDDVFPFECIDEIANTGDGVEEFERDGAFEAEFLELGGIVTKNRIKYVYGAFEAEFLELGLEN